jgi:hypothetical protein
VDPLTPKEPSEDTWLGKFHDAVLKLIPAGYRNVAEAAFAFAAAGYTLYTLVAPYLARGN